MVLSGRVRRYSRRNWRFFFMRAMSSSIRIVRSALSALDSPISGGFRICALKWRSSSSLGESYSSKSYDCSCAIVSLRFVVCSSVEEAWEGSSPDSGLFGTSFSGDWAERIVSNRFQLPRDGSIGQLIWGSRYGHEEIQFALGCASCPSGLWWAFRDGGFIQLVLLSVRLTNCAHEFGSSLCDAFIAHFEGVQFVL